jgi:hypothetical protein
MTQHGGSATCLSFGIFFKAKLKTFDHSEEHALLSNLTAPGQFYLTVILLYAKALRMLIDLISALMFSRLPYSHWIIDC